MLWNDKQYNESMISLPFCQFVNVGVPISLFLKEQIKGIQFCIVHNRQCQPAPWLLRRGGRQSAIQQEQTGSNQRRVEHLQDLQTEGG